MKMRNVVRLLASSACMAVGLLAASQMVIGGTVLGGAEAGATATCSSYDVLLAHADGSITSESVGGLGNCAVVPFGSMAGKTLNAPIVGIASLPGGAGYWLVASDGGVFTFGQAQYYGSMGGKPLNAPIVGIVSTPDGGGYYLVASDGGIFTFGDAKYQGSTGNLRLNAPVIGMAVDSASGGYWLVASDGGTFNFNVTFIAPSFAGKLNAPMRFMVGTPSGAGFRVVASDGGVFNYGDAVYYGSAAGISGINWQAMAASQDNGGYWLFSNSPNRFALKTASFGDANPTLAYNGGDQSFSLIVGAAPYSAAPNTAPAVTQNPASIDPAAGTTATFTAAATGTPAPTVQWQVSIDQGASYTNITNATSTTLSFQTTQGESGGFYRAVFANNSGTATTAAAVLTVGGQPDVTTNPQSQSVVHGNTATFTTAASGNPAPTVQWEMSTDGGMTWTGISGATSTTYSFSTTSGQNGYKYRALWSNSVGGTFTTVATLTVT
ncbi:MAG TPA: immunoglobulin domain-containing protein [Acidimicrobiales bacterium]|nr:immunoglobulin domain-containing protein [Acidimicrobiales bacterium]